MNERVKNIAEQARQLTSEERLELLALLEEMAEEEMEFDPAQIEEWQRRSAAYDRGEIQSYTWEEVKARIWK
jgi:putative addiction module component (TIGR02574 family)